MSFYERSQPAESASQANIARFYDTNTPGVGLIPSRPRFCYACARKTQTICAEHILLLECSSNSLSYLLIGISEAVSQPASHLLFPGFKSMALCEKDQCINRSPADHV